MASEPLIPSAAAKLIGDKLYDKRKRAALQIEQIMKQLAATGNDTRITAIIQDIVKNYADNPQVNQRKGGLLCLAAAAVGLGARGAPHLRLIVPPVLNGFTDQDSRVRYYSCEALYNIAKVARDDFLPFFPGVFDALFKICADSERNVQNAAQFLDNLIKDIVAASPTFDVAGFVPTLREYMSVVNPFKRQFLVSWVTVLDSVPGGDLLPTLPLLLGPLLAMVEDPNRELHLAVMKLLKEFHSELETVEPGEGSQVSFAAMGVILVEYAHSQDSGTVALSLSWLGDYLVRAPLQLVPLAAPILAAVLPSLSHSTPEISQAAKETNRQLLDVVERCGSSSSSSSSNSGVYEVAQQLQVADVLLVVASQLGSRTEATRLAALAWADSMLRCSKSEVLAHAPLLIPALLAAVSATSLPVANRAIGVLATVAENEQQFPVVVEALVSLFRGTNGTKLLALRGAAVIRGLAARLGGEQVFCAIAAAVEDEKDLAFAANFVQALNLLLLTAPEAAKLRSLLKGAFTTGSTSHDKSATRHSEGSHSDDHHSGGIGGSASKNSSGDSSSSSSSSNRSSSSKRGAVLFDGIHRCWSHSAGAVLLLCLLCRAYNHAADIVACFEELPTTVKVIVQLDRLVGLLETPPFTFLRLHLLDPCSYPSLLRAMYGILQILPQSDAFRTLHARLHAAPAAALLALSTASGTSTGNAETISASIPGQPTMNALRKAHRFPELLDHFMLLQEKHAVAEAATDKHSQLPCNNDCHPIPSTGT